MRNQSRQEDRLHKRRSGFKCNSQFGYPTSRPCDDNQLLFCVFVLGILIVRYDHGTWPTLLWSEHSQLRRTLWCFPLRLSAVGSTNKFTAMALRRPSP